VVERYFEHLRALMSALRAIARDLRDMRAGYRPERHYMRGRGPAWVAAMTAAAVVLYIVLTPAPTPVTYQLASGVSDPQPTWWPYLLMAWLLAVLGYSLYACLRWRKP
jgi:hypothetical protein